MTGGVHVQVKNLSRVHVKAGATIKVLDQVSFELPAGDRVAVVGPSGCGKSTFLHILGLLDAPTSGEVYLDDVASHTLTNVSRARLRNQRIGYVFQAHHLLPEHTALGNVCMPVRLAGAPVAVAESRARTLLEAVGLKHRLTHRPGELSGGEQQRVAIARALVMGPGLVLADEPTGNLDPRTASSVFELLLDLNRALGSTLVVVTHSSELADRFPRRISLEQGKFKLT